MGSAFPEQLCLNCVIVDGCDEKHVQCLYRIWRKEQVTVDQKQANVAKVAKWYAENKERRHAYLRERYKRMKGGEVRGYERNTEK